MNADRWRQVDELFDVALDLHMDERERFLKDACKGDEELCGEVLSLLKAHEKIDCFLNIPAIELAGKALAQEKAIINDTFIGREIGPYKVEELLGAGGMGEVYLAKDARLERKVALKLLPSHLTLSRENILRFEREARAASALNHPNILTVYDIGHTTDDVRYIATEFVDGETLRDRLKNGPMRAEDALDVALQITGALKAAHEAGIVHRDIKPENIMLRPDSIVKVLDFGLAKLTEGHSSSVVDGNATKKELTATGAVMGTASYMSPEQALGLDVDQRSDIFSFGVVLYEMLTGKQPFKAATAAATFDAILNRDPQRLVEINEAVPVEFESIIERALEKKVKYRYQTVWDMRADLKSLTQSLNTNTGFHTTGASSFRSTAKTKPLRSMWTGFGGLFPFIVFISIVFVALFAWHLVTNKLETPEPQRLKMPIGNLSFTKLTSQTGEEIHPSLSPDGKAFVYASRASGNLDIYLQRTGEQDFVNLTEGSGANETQPAFSTDGSKIAFALYDKKGSIFIMGANGESKRRLTDFGYNPSWSPDDKEIVFATDKINALNARADVTSELWIVNVDTGAKRSLPVEDGVQPNWSPGGERIAYWALSKGGQRDIWTISTKGDAPVAVTNDAATDGNPVWSHDGKYLYFASDRGGSMNFWRVAIDEKTGRTLDQPEPMTTPSSYSKHLSAARDGRHFVYVQSSSNINLHTIPFDSDKEKVLDKASAVTQGANQVSNSDLSPDGEWFAFGLQTENQEDIYVMKRDGTNRKRLTNDKAKDRSPRWSPDGKRITFFSDRSGRYEAWTIDIESFELKQVTFTNGPEVVYPFWSADGTGFVYSCWDNESYIIDANKKWDEQTPVQLPEFPAISGYFWAKSWSPDGKRLGGWHVDGGAAGIVIYDLEKQTYERLTDYGDDPVWLKDNRRLLFRHQDKIYIVDSQDKKAKEVYSLSPQRITFFGLSRDNRTIFFNVIWEESEIWMFTVE